MHAWLVNKAGVESFYQKGIVEPMVQMSQHLCTYLDIGCIDRMTYILSDWVRVLGREMRRLQTGNLQHYLLYIVAGFALIGWWVSGVIL